MKLRLLATGLIAGVALPAFLAANANADHRQHWFFDSYNQYEAEAYEIYTPRRWKRRPMVIYEDEEFYDRRRAKRLRKMRRKAARQRRWRERRIRYDLAPNGAKLAKDAERRKRKRIVKIPLPRENPIADYPISDYSIDEPELTTGSISDPVEATRLDQPKTQTATVTTTKTSRARTIEDRPKKKKPAKSKKSNGNLISCGKAEEIVAGFGFTNIEARSCSGKSYDFAAKRDGKPFTIKLSSASGELTEVTRN